MVHLLIGHVYDRYDLWSIGPTTKFDAALDAEIRQRLLGEYGLSLKEQDRAIRLYLWTKSVFVAMRYLSDQFELEQDALQLSSTW